MSSIGHIETVRGFMEAVWSVTPHANAARQIYRGQTNNWDLLPRLFRDRLRDPVKLNEIGDRLLQEFAHRCPYLLPSLPKYTMDWMSLAQHFGLPTRLLDWTGNPLIGLFFALDGLEILRPTVWVWQVTTEQLDAAMVMQPERHSHRVAAQAGWHSVHSLDAHGDLQALNKVDSISEQLVRILVHPNAAKALRSELKEMGLTYSTVYGDLLSVCREIEIDLQVPADILREARHDDVQHRLQQGYVLSHMLRNGHVYKVGDEFEWMSQPNKWDCAVGHSVKIDEDLLAMAKRMAR